MAWEQATSLDQLREGPVVFRSGPRQLALFLAGDETHAIDNRCPHEGYPLAQGTVDEGCVLTCNWHNWKFNLDDGRCLLGGDHVRRYETRVEDGQVWVNVADPPSEEIQQFIIEGLEKAFKDRDFGRMCRELSRLHFHQLDPLLGVKLAIHWCHDRFQYGFKHCLAATADWLQVADRREDWEEKLICLAEAIDHMSFDSLRHPPYPFPEPAPYDRDQLLAAIEREQSESAEAMVAGALDEGVTWKELEEVFATAALAHYNSFGHSMIYVYKARQLVDRFGDEVARPLALSLVRQLCFATREDLIPEFQDYGPALADYPSRVGDQPSCEDAPFPATITDALAWVAERAGESLPETIHAALLEALARNMLHFDITFQLAVDRHVQDNVSWLQFTHSLTFSNAVRYACSRYPELWPQGLLQMALFLGRSHRSVDLAAVAEDDWQVDDVQVFLEGAFQVILDHGLRDPIFSAHVLKTTVAVEEEVLAAGESRVPSLLPSLNRFLNSPLKQKHVRRLARQANELVSRDFAGD
ncbi:MAG: Rieske (2Fe-2S) protein [Pirellulaceae bacterium]|nr:Rieske (2Fe-2S) protein [Pirellulaceae bacterium]